MIRKSTEKNAHIRKSTLTVANKPREELEAVGKSLRTTIPRESHAGWEAPEGRPNPIDILTLTNEGREPDLIPIRYGRMLESPFAFFRGAAAIMAADLAKTPNTGIHVQICGDCHLMNFGSYATPERRIVFDISDFDETLPAPWEWDVKRLATSFIIACAHNKISEKDAEDIARECIESYREHMEKYAAMDFLDMWYSSISAEDILNISGYEEAKKRYRRRIKKAAQKDVIDDDFPKMAEIKNGRGYIKDNPPLIYHYHESEKKTISKNIHEAFEKYRSMMSEDKKVLLDHFEFHDMAAKVVGVGSVGTRSGIVLCMSADNEILFLQVKEARDSILEPYAGKSTYKNSGERIINGQKLMQAASDIFLGWTETSAGRQFYLRQLRDMKIKPQVEIFDDETMKGYAKLCGWTLARAHARSGNAALISGYLGDNSKFEDAIAQFAIEYAEQNEKDFEALKNAVKQGLVEVHLER